MRIDDKQIAAHEFAERIRGMQTEWNDMVQEDMTELVFEQKESIPTWFGEETADALDLLSDERMHSVIEYENALKLLKPYDDAYVEQQEAFDAATAAFREKTDALAHGYGFSGNFPDYVRHDGKKAHFLRFSTIYTNEGEKDEACFALGAMDAAGKTGGDDPQTIPPSSLRRLEWLAQQTAPFLDDGTLSGEQTEELLRYVDFSARRALMRRVSADEKKRYIRYTRHMTLALLIFCAIGGALYGLILPLALLFWGISPPEYFPYALLSGSLFGGMLFVLLFFVSRR